MNRAETPFGPGIGESQRRILGLIKRSGECTLAQLEAEFDLNRETLRTHLKSLVAMGLVERPGVHRKGPGRPHVLYRLTAAGEALFPRREGELLGELADFLHQNGRRDLLEEFFERRLARRRRELAPRVAGLRGRERLEAIAGILSEQGFVAEVVAGDGMPGLRLCHCPLRDLVAVSELPCRFEKRLIESLLGERSRRETFMLEGDHACTYAVGPLSRLGRKRGAAPAA
ncbi:MAG TPA: MarR family transcriptional regulator [Thermoanaerobaculia bacterium]|nr:MarR family transcriptional regulator [Thermoanaerobaculia bacterium]